MYSGTTLIRAPQSSYPAALVTVEPRLLYGVPRLSSTQHLDYPAWQINDIHNIFGVL